MREHDISQRRACQLVGVDPKTVRRERPPHCPQIRSAMREIAGQRRRLGYRRIGSFSRSAIRRMIFKSPMWITQLPPPLIALGKGHMGQISMEITRQPGTVLGGNRQGRFRAR
jgi:hypothetical protein